MARKRPESGLDDLVGAAASVFSSHGFRRTQMAEIAKAMGVSAGTLYGYVESKEALFDLTVQRAFLDEPPPAPELPVRTPARDEVIAHVRARMANARSPSLSAALRRGAPADGDARAELETILREVYGFLYDNRRGLALIERAAVDRPELAAVYFEQGRAGLLGRLERYLASRIEGGFFEPVPDVPVAARLLLETIAWFARHRHDDFDGGVHDDALAEETVITMLTRSLSRSDS
jgi:AcrR family transcriptional regulator